MKEFKKNEQGFFICEECEKIFKTRQSFGNHIGGIHKTKDYYDKWLKDENDGYCKICGKETKFKFLNGYKNCCSKECNKKYNVLRTEEEIYKKYKVKHAANIPGIQDKKRKTCIEKYGCEVSSQSQIVKNHAKENNIKNYGVENVFQLKKIKDKCKIKHLKNLGVEYPGQSEIIKNKKKHTCLNNFGVEAGFADVEKRSKTNEIRYNAKHAMQNKTIFEKSQKNSYYSKKFGNTNINYRGSYELDFLEKYYYKYPDIINGPTIKYIFENKEHAYFPDFYIPSLNLIIEIKNSYLVKKDKDKIKAKKKATISKGFKYNMIIDKNYQNSAFA